VAVKVTSTCCPISRYGTEYELRFVPKVMKLFGATFSVARRLNSNGATGSGDSIGFSDARKHSRRE
jgi:hypothetical protein